MILRAFMFHLMRELPLDTLRRTQIWIFYRPEVPTRAYAFQMSMEVIRHDLKLVQREQERAYSRNRISLQFYRHAAHKLAALRRAHARALRTQWRDVRRFDRA